MFAKLRDWRKEMAGKESNPVYTICTNDQLAEIATKKITTLKGLEEVNGIGEARIKKYGEAMLNIVKQEIQAGNQARSA